MNILYWNYQELGNRRTIRDLCWFVKAKRFKLVFIMKTKLRCNKVEQIKLKTSFNSMLVVECIGRNGGLALMWFEVVKAEIQNYSRRHINAKITPSNGPP